MIESVGLITATYLGALCVVFAVLNLIGIIITKDKI